MHSYITGALFIFSLALAPAAGSLLESDCDGCGISGTVAQADGSTLTFGDGDTFSTGHINGQEPSSASGSWDFDVQNSGTFDLENGICGPVTPGPGCSGEVCKLTCTNSFKVVLRDKQPLPGSGSTGPVPGAGWGTENNHKWTWEMSLGEEEEIPCSTEEDTCFDLTINWTHGGASKTFEFKFCCEQCKVAVVD